MAGTRQQLTLDLRDQPRLLDMLRILAAMQKTTQKAIVVEALTAYFSQRQETLALWQAAARTFAEWENEEDRVYDAL